MGFLYGFQNRDNVNTFTTTSNAFSPMPRVTQINMSSAGKIIFTSRGTSGNLFKGNSSLETLVEFYVDGYLNANDFTGCTSLTHCIFKTDAGIDFTTHNCNIKIAFQKIIQMAFFYVRPR